MQKTTQLIGLLCLCSVLLYSCKKTEGCTDNQATNYNPDAEKNDGSCVFPYDAYVGTYSVKEQYYGDYCPVDSIYYTLEIKAGTRGIEILADRLHGNLRDVPLLIDANSIYLEDVMIIMAEGGEIYDFTFMNGFKVGEVINISYFLTDINYFGNCGGINCTAELTKQ